MYITIVFYFIETHVQQASAKTWEAIDHMTSLCQVEKRFHSQESSPNLFLEI